MKNDVEIVDWIKNQEYFMYIKIKLTDNEYLIDIF